MSNKHKGVKWAIIFIGGDLLLAVACVVAYALVTPEPKIQTTNTTFKEELTKAQKEAMQHTGR